MSGGQYAQLPLHSDPSSEREVIQLSVANIEVPHILTLFIVDRDLPSLGKGDSKFLTANAYVDGERIGIDVESITPNVHTVGTCRSRHTILEHVHTPERIRMHSFCNEPSHAYTL